MDEIISVLSNITSGLFGANGAIPTFWNFLTGEGVIEYFLIGCGVSLLLLAIRTVKGIFWGV